MKSSRTSTAGMTLLECLGYIAVFSVVINLGLSIFVSSTRLATLTTVALDRLNAVEDVREAFSRTVHEGAEVVSGIESYATGAEQLVLTYPPTPESDGWRRYVVFGRITSSAGLGRLDILEKNGTSKVDSLVNYALPVKTIEFKYDTERPTKARLITLEVDVPMSTSKDPRPPRMYRFASALRGISE